MAALLARRSTGKGAYLDVAVADGALWLMSLAVDEHLATGSSPRPGHDVLSGRYACYGNYEAADGRWIAVGAIEPKFFANLCRALGCDEVGRASVRRRVTRTRSARILLRRSPCRDRDDWVE